MESGPILPSQAKKETEIRDVLFVFLKRSWVLVLAVAVSGWFGYQNSKRIPNQYESSALLVLANSGIQRNEVGSIGDQNVESPDLVLFQSLLTSKVVLTSVMRKPFQRNPGAPEVPIATLLHADTANRTSMQLGAQRLSNWIHVSDQGDGTLKVSYHSADPDLCPVIVDLVVDVAQEQLKLIRLERLQMVQEKMRLSVEDSHRRLAAASLAVAKFKDANISLESAELQAKLSDLQSEESVLQEDYLALRKRYNQLLIERDQILVPAIVFDPASRPATLIGPNRWQGPQLAGFIGLVVGILLVAVWEFLLRKRPG